jgi:hypothetical protein
VGGSEEGGVGWTIGDEERDGDRKLVGREPPINCDVGSEFGPVEEARGAEDAVDPVAERFLERGAGRGHARPELPGEGILLLGGQGVAKRFLGERQEVLLDAALVGCHRTARSELGRVLGHVLHG